MLAPLSHNTYQVAGRVHSVQLGLAVRAHRRLNIIGGGLSLASVAIPWYLAYCEAFIASWLFQQYPAVLVLVVVGGVLALLSRFGGALTLFGSLLFLATINLPFSSYTKTSLPGIIVSESLPCMGAPYGIYQPIIFHAIGFWFALLGGLISLMGSPWTIPWLSPGSVLGRGRCSASILRAVGLRDTETREQIVISTTSSSQNTIQLSCIAHRMSNTPVFKAIR